MGSQTLNIEPRYETLWCKTPQEIESAQQLRYKIFKGEMGAMIASADNGLDTDEFDPWCEQLIVKDRSRGIVIGTYRALLPEKARKIGRLYAEGEFDLGSLKDLAPRSIEIGRSCVHPDYRRGGAIMALWRGLGALIRREQYEFVLGCVSVPMLGEGRYAWNLFRQCQRLGLVTTEFNAQPLKGRELSVDSFLETVRPPPLLKGYLKLGAIIVAPPAIDPLFGTADFLTLLQLSKIDPRYARHFLDSC
jgi:putative hemolysin